MMDTPFALYSIKYVRKGFKGVKSQKYICNPAANCLGRDDTSLPEMDFRPYKVSKPPSIAGHPDSRKARTGRKQGFSKRCEGLLNQVIALGPG